MKEEEIVNLWLLNPSINPLTKRNIKKNGPIYNKLKKLSNKYDKSNDRYDRFRKEKIDPILLMELPLFDMKDKDLFIYKNKWNPYNGEILGVDPTGPLFFDPNTLIHYFYINRLNNLWINDTYEDGEYIQGHYGDAVGNGPEFNIQGRGKHPDWYLFRLPIMDCYLNKDHCHQSVTMGPILNNEEIKKLYNLSKRYKKKFKEVYGYKRPNLIEMKNLYDKCIISNDTYDTIEDISSEEKKHMKYQDNVLYVEELKKF